MHAAHCISESPASARRHECPRPRRATRAPRRRRPARAHPRPTRLSRAPPQSRAARAPQRLHPAPAPAGPRARTHPLPSDTTTDIAAGLARLQASAGTPLHAITDFFSLFPAIHLLTSAPAPLTRATHGVLAAFLDGAPPDAAYIELRTTPRATPHMSRRACIEAVLRAVEARPAARAALVVSVDRRMAPSEACEVVRLAAQLRREGRRVVGVDLCGDPTVGDMTLFVELFAEARAAGLGVTLHIAEALVLARRTCVEICLTSNLLCKTVQRLEDHHIRYYLARNHPIAICTDDILPFRTSLLGEYALLMAPPPLGLGLSEAEIETVARMGMESRFPPAPAPALDSPADADAV
ncbi:hypothetical protein BC834DRAFT_967114 [Gloeopeniophorella convolvens]|nr:hypothetical protein BC834DRAFT_967114 [Gloeopeniophorella convolvens]